MKNHPGMQGTQYFDNPEIIDGEPKNIISGLKSEWLKARDLAILKAEHLASMNLTKQIVNRLLEPFMWHTVLVSAYLNGKISLHSVMILMLRYICKKLLA